MDGTMTSCCTYDIALIAIVAVVSKILHVFLREFYARLLTLTLYIQLHAN